MFLHFFPVKTSKKGVYLTFIASLSAPDDIFLPIFASFNVYKSNASFTLNLFLILINIIFFQHLLE